MCSRSVCCRDDGSSSNKSRRSSSRRKRRGNSKQEWPCSAVAVAISTVASKLKDTHILQNKCSAKRTLQCHAGPILRTELVADRLPPKQGAEPHTFVSSLGSWIEFLEWDLEQDCYLERKTQELFPPQPRSLPGMEDQKSLSTCAK